MLRDEIKFCRERSVSRRAEYYFAGLIINGAGRAPNPAGKPGKAQGASAPKFTSGILQGFQNPGGFGKDSAHSGK